jgi:hypothetical protein
VIYFGPNACDWATEHLTGLTWLRVSPLSAKPVYPIGLDLLEAAGPHIAHRVGGPLSWQQWLRSGNCPGAPGTAAWREIGRGTESASERSVVTSIACEIAALGPSFGVMLRNIHLYDYFSIVLAKRLLREALLGRTTVVVDGPWRTRELVRFRDELAKAVPVTAPVGPRSINFAINFDRATGLVALSPHGIPIDVLKTLTNLPARPGYHVTIGSDGRDWAYVGLRSRRRALSRWTPSEARRQAARLFRAWPPDGLNYLRRGGFAMLANRADLMRSQHRAYVGGLSTMGRDFLLRYFVRLANCHFRSGATSKHYLPALIGAARMASEISSEAMFRSACWHYRIALRQARDPSVKAAIMCELGQLYAARRDPADRSKALKALTRADALLDRVPAGESRLQLMIQVTNACALVEYREGRHVKAMQLEEKARTLAASCRSQYPALHRWAIILLNRNSARLLEIKFGDRTAAAALLGQNVELRDDSEDKARIELARVYFDSAGYQDVVDLLAPIYQCRGAVGTDERRELFGRSLLLVALARTGRGKAAEAQMERIAYLGFVNDLAGASRLAEWVDNATIDSPMPANWTSGLA